MPTISMFYGIIVEIRYDDHNPPHIHAEYGEYEASFDFDGNIIKGSFPPKKTKLIAAWAEIHSDELEANWKLVKSNKQPFPIDPLK